MKTHLVVLLLSSMLFFTGCGDTNKTASSNAPQSGIVKTEPFKTTTEAGKAFVMDASRSIGSNGEIVSYEWRDSSGKLLSTQPTLDRLFLEEGTYDMTLTVTDANGNRTQKDVIVTVTRTTQSTPAKPNQPPVAKAKASAHDIMSGESVHFEDDGSYDPDGKIVKWEWRDMDGILLSDTKTLDRTLYYDPQYDRGDGTTRYVKTLYVTDDKGAMSSISFEVIVKKVEKAPLAPSDLKATSVTATSLTLTWKDNADNEDRFEIYKDGALVKTVPANTTSAQIDGLAAGSLHKFFVKAVNAQGSSVSGEIGVKTKSATFAVTKTYTYDQAGRVIKEDFNNGKYIEYTYDDNGNLINQNVVGGE